LPATVPFKNDIPLLYRHDASRIAGQVRDIKATDAGLYVRATLTDEDARQCQGWSVCATIHRYHIFHDDDPRAFYSLCDVCDPGRNQRYGPVMSIDKLRSAYNTKARNIVPQQYVLPDDWRLASYADGAPQMVDPKPAPARPKTRPGWV